MTPFEKGIFIKTIITYESFYLLLFIKCALTRDL